MTVLNYVMGTLANTPKPQILRLVTASATIIDNSLVIGTEPEAVKAGSQGSDIRNWSLWGRCAPVTNPHEELYFAMLEASQSAEPPLETRFRLFGLLAQIVERDRTREAQQECALCAGALMAGNAEEAARSVARLAAAKVARSSATITGRSFGSKSRHYGSGVV